VVYARTVLAVIASLERVRHSCSFVTNSGRAISVSCGDPPAGPIPSILLDNFGVPAKPSVEAAITVALEPADARYRLLPIFRKLHHELQLFLGSSPAGPIPSILLDNFGVLVKPIVEAAITVASEPAGARYRLLPIFRKLHHELQLFLGSSPAGPEAILPILLDNFGVPAKPRVEGAITVALEPADARYRLLPIFRKLHHELQLFLGSLPAGPEAILPILLDNFGVPAKPFSEAAITVALEPADARYRLLPIFRKLHHELQLFLGGLGGPAFLGYMREQFWP